MKTLDQITEEFLKIDNLNISNIFDNSDSKDWIFYKSIAGYLKGNYFNIYFMMSKYGRTVEISHNSRSINDIFELLKQIEPNQEITYYTLEPKKHTS